MRETIPYYATINNITFNISKTKRTHIHMNHTRHIAFNCMKMFIKLVFFSKFYYYKINRFSLEMLYINVHVV